MAATTIAWTVWTFNAWRGCEKFSPGCAQCFAEGNVGVRLPGIQWGRKGTRMVLANSGWKKPGTWDRKAAREGRKDLVFTASLSDVFEDWKGPMVDHEHKVVPDLTMQDVRERLFTTIDDTPNLIWQVLTKRPENIPSMWIGGARSNVWLGTSPCDQATAERHVPDLLAAKGLAQLPFLSVEPLLGPVDLGPWLDELGWVIVGGESGKDARPCDLDAMHDLVGQCQDAGVPVFVKQLGANCGFKTKDRKGGDIDEFPKELQVRQMP